MKVFIVVLVTYFLVVVIKLIGFLISSKKKTFKSIFRNSFGNGNFPSSHNAIMSALTTSIFFETGVSWGFSLSFWLMLIIMSDSFNTRGAISKNSITLNKLTKSKIHDERVGHSWIEIFAGLVLGLIISCISYLIF